MTLEDLPVAVRWPFDWVAIGIAVGTVAQALPAIAAALTIIWTTIRIFETDTVRSFLSRRRARKDQDIG